MGASGSTFVRDGTLAHIAPKATCPFERVPPERNMSISNHIPATVDASLGARLAPFCGTPRAALEALDVENARAVTPRAERRSRAGFIEDLKLLFAALGAGGGAGPPGALDPRASDDAPGVFLYNQKIPRVTGALPVRD